MSYKIEDITNKIICGDVIEELQKIPNESIDIVVTSPPYNLLNTTGRGMKSPGRMWKNPPLKNGYGKHDDNMPYNEYILWRREVLTELMRVIPDNGAIFYNHKWRVQNKLLQDRSEILEGFPVRQIIIWDKGSSINFNKHFFLPTYEVIYLIAKPDFKLSDEGYKKSSVWKIGTQKADLHPAPFPVKLIDNILESVDGKIVLDPFMGSGTTAISCIKNKKTFIGIELEERFVEVANKRISDFIYESGINFYFNRRGK